MDNIQRSVISVLGVACFVALIIPSNNPVAPPAAAPQEQAPPLQTVNPDAAPLPENVEEEVGAENATDELQLPDELATFGQPMSDAMPLGESNNPSNENEAQTGLRSSSPGGNSNEAVSYAGSAAGGYMIPANVPDRAIQ